MLSQISAVSSLLLGIGALLVGAGLLGTLLPVRGHLEGFTELQIGIVMGSYYVGFVAGTALCPWMVRRVGHIRAFATLAAMAIVSILAHAVFISPVAWMFLRATVGASMIGLYITVESWLNERADRYNRGRILASYEMVAMGSMALGQFLIAVGQLESTLPFLIAAAMFAIGVVPVALTQLPEPEPGATQRFDMRQLFAVSPLAVVGTLTCGFGAGAFFSLGPVYAQQLELAPTGIASFMSAALVGSALLQWPVGGWSDRTDRRIVICAASLTAAVAAVALLSFARIGLIALLPCAFLYGGTVTVLYSLCVAHANDLLPQKQYLDAARGFNFLYAVGAMSAPVVTGGLMARFGGPGLFATCGVLLLGLGLYAIRRIMLGPVVPVETRDKFVPVATISPCEPQMHPREPVATDPQ
jgi:MFS family permease